MVTALNALRQNPQLASDVNALWQIACGGTGKLANHQMDVLAALWNEGLTAETLVYAGASIWRMPRLFPKIQQDTGVARLR